MQHDLTVEMLIDQQHDSGSRDGNTTIKMKAKGHHQTNKK